MHIAIDARYLGAEFSGIGVYSENLVEALARADDENEYTVIVHDSYLGHLKVGPNFRIVTERARPVSLRTVTTLSRLVRASGADTLHSLFPLAPLGWGGRLVVTVYDLQPLMDPEFTGRRNPAKRFLYDSFYRFAYPACFRKADFILSSSYATKEHIARLFPDVAEKVLVIHGGVDPDSFNEPDEAEIERTRAKRGIPERFLFYIGSTRPNKNLMNMLEAFDLFRTRHPEHEDLHWVMILSKDRFWEPVFSEIRRRDLLGRILILDQVNESEKQVFFHLAEMLYFVTKFEGFGLPLLEAQAQGVPVLASTHSSLPEIAGASAILADPDDPEAICDALERFYADPGLRARMAEAGRDNVKRFTWNRVAREIVNVYNHMLGERR